ncbi:hypothetical protein FRB97_003173, partial [Tulasnella sp. 331]
MSDITDVELEVLESQSGHDLLEEPVDSHGITDLTPDAPDDHGVLLAPDIEPKDMTSEPGRAATRVVTPAVPYPGYRTGHSIDLMSLDGGTSLPGDPRDFKVLSIGCWMEDGFFAEQLPWHYLVFACESQSETHVGELFVRVGLIGWNVSDRMPRLRVDVAGSSAALKSGRTQLLADFLLESHMTDQSDLNLRLVGELLHTPFSRWNPPNDRRFVKIYYGRMRDLYRLPLNTLDTAVDTIHTSSWDNLLRQEDGSTLPGDLHEYKISRLSVWCQPPTTWTSLREYLLIDAYAPAEFTSSKIYLRVGQSRWGRSPIKPAPIVHLSQSERSLTTNLDLVSTLPISGNDEGRAILSLKLLQDTMWAVYHEAPAVALLLPHWRFAYGCYAHVWRLLRFGRLRAAPFTSQPPSPGVRQDLLSRTGGNTIPGDPANAKIIRVSYWEQRGFMKPSYVIVESEAEVNGQSTRLYLRVQEEEAVGWLGRMDMTVSVATSEDVLTQNSKRVADIIINQRPGLNFLNLRVLGNVMNGVCDGHTGVLSRVFARRQLASICFHHLMARQLTGRDDSVVESPSTPIGGRIGRLEDLLSTDGGISLPADPRRIKLLSVTWYKKYGISNWRHEYLVFGCGYSSDMGGRKLYVRVERSKDAWTTTTPEPWILVADSIDTITSKSYAIAAFFMDNETTQNPEVNLKLVGELLRIVNDVAPR